MAPLFEANGLAPLLAMVETPVQSPLWNHVEKEGLVKGLVVVGDAQLGLGLEGMEVAETLCQPEFPSGSYADKVCDLVLEVFQLMGALVLTIQLVVVGERRLDQTQFGTCCRYIIPSIQLVDLLQENAPFQTSHHIPSGTGE